MKYLLVMAVVLVAFYVWRSGRQAEHEQPPRARKPLPAPGIMVACEQCGTHLPESESVSGRLGRYCSPEHREQREGHGE